MGTALVVFAVMSLVALAIVGVVIAWGVHQVVTANWVSATVPGTAPLTWLGSPVACARLHRRLRRAVGCAHAAVAVLPPGPAQSELTAMATELEQRAAMLDRHVVVAHRAPTR